MRLDFKKVQLAQAQACLSNDDLVAKTGIGRTSISRAINGRIESKPKTIGLIAKALNVDVSEIILNEEVQLWLISLN